MSFRFFLSLATAALYALLAGLSTRAPLLESHGYRPAFFEQSLEFFAVWTLLLIAYALGGRRVSRTGGSWLFAWIFVSSAVFRLLVLSGAGFGHPAPHLFFQGPAPLADLLVQKGVAPDALRLFATAADLGTLALMPGLLRRFRLPVGAAILYGWNPLVIVELAGNGRVEAFAILGALLAVRLALTPRLHWAAALCFGVSMTGAPVFIASAPAFAKKLGAWTLVSLGAAWMVWKLALPSAILDQLFPWPPGGHLGGSLAPALAVLSRLFIARSALAPLIASVLAWLAVALFVVSRKASSLPKNILLLIGSFLFLSPQVAPWSFVAVAAFAPFTENRGWLVFTATAPLTYLAFGERGDYSFWLGFAQYFAPYAAVIFSWLGRPPSRTAAG